MEFIPQPKKLEHRVGVFTLAPHTAIILEQTPFSALLYAKQLQNDITTETGLKLALEREHVGEGGIVLRLDTALPENTSAISVTQTGVTLAAGSDEALCNGVQTLRQMARRYGALWPCMEIEDTPDLANRGYYLDIARGRVPTLQTLKEYADLLCLCKINEWQLYVEHTYLFRGLSEAWRDDTPLTAEDIMELDAYCAARHIELVPSLATFGHMYKVLSTKTCCAFCELDDAERQPFSYLYAGAHHTLNVSNPGTIGFIEGLISEYMQLFTSKKFNICCDETYDLGKGRSLKLAEEKGERGLYMEHVRTLCQFLVDSGRTPMFWGDIMWRFPEAIQMLPKETICLNWGYLPNQREDEMRMLAEAGATQYACPGVCGWKQWIPLYQGAYDNIVSMCNYARKFSAVGVLNTDWGDWGHINHPWLTVPGVLYGAAFSWNAQKVPYTEINAAISRLVYRDSSENIMAVMTEFSGWEVFNWEHAVHWIETRTRFDEVDATQTAAANKALDAAVSHLHLAARSLDSTQREIVDTFCIVSEGVKIWNDIGVYIAQSCFNQSIASPCQEGAALAQRLEFWYQSYLRLWRQVSRESEVARITNIITRYGDFLRNREAG